MRTIKEFDLMGILQLIMNQEPEASEESKAEASKKTSARKVFSHTAQVELETAFRISPYLTAWKRQCLSQKLNLTERQVRVWFQNRRMRIKSEHRHQRRVCHAPESPNQQSMTSSPPPYLSMAPTCYQGNECSNFTPSTTQLQTIQQAIMPCAYTSAASSYSPTACAFTPTPCEYSLTPACINVDTSNMSDVTRMTNMGNRPTNEYRLHHADFINGQCSINDIKTQYTIRQCQYNTNNVNNLTGMAPTYFDTSMQGSEVSLLRNIDYQQLTSTFYDQTATNNFNNFISYNNVSM